jgi:haloacetate dehalogenase
MDILPNYHVWTNTTMSWAIGTWHWGFMAQPEPFPERLISAVPARYFIESRMLIRGPHGARLPNRGSDRRICALLHSEDHHRLMP